MNENLSRELNRSFVGNGKLKKWKTPKGIDDDLVRKL
jgi:hypothetical protein